MKKRDSERSVENQQQTVLLIFLVMHMGVLTTMLVIAPKNPRKQFSVISLLDKFLPCLFTFLDKQFV